MDKGVRTNIVIHRFHPTLLAMQFDVVASEHRIITFRCLQYRLYANIIHVVQ